MCHSWLFRHYVPLRTFLALTANAPCTTELIVKRCRIFQPASGEPQTDLHFIVVKICDGVVLLELDH
uniref:Secreted protein n=1 Tax=Ascaris lumbricoides TaxID=6252 RepID=A0A0M3HRY3_ASCLU